MSLLPSVTLFKQFVFVYTPYVGRLTFPPLLVPCKIQATDKTGEGSRRLVEFRLQLGGWVEARLHAVSTYMVNTSELLLERRPTISTK